MAKDRTDAEIQAKKDRKDKKEKKRKLDDAEEVEVVSEKQKKKDKKRKSTDAGTVAVDADGDVIIDDSAAVLKEEDDTDDKKPIAVKMEIPLAALVPFANPLCDDKSQRKVLKGVKKAAKHKSIKRGVKEVVKCVRKSPLANPSTSATALPNGIVVLAADISPMDVISHIPVLCEDHNIPYVYVPSRAELGAAGATKRPTSVVMLMPRGKEVKKDEGDAEDGEKEGWEDTFKDLHRLALKLGQHVKV